MAGRTGCCRTTASSPGLQLGDPGSIPGSTTTTVRGGGVDGNAKIVSDGNPPLLKIDGDVQKMGLDCSHDAWHGAYSAFMHWREAVAYAAGLPPLRLMEGFGNHYLTPRPWEQFLAQLPIKWECLKPDPLHILLRHSDCDGEIAPEDCTAIADRLDALIPVMPDEDGGGHIGNWREKTAQFVRGLRKAAAEGVPLAFH